MCVKVREAGMWCVHVECDDLPTLPLHSSLCALCVDWPMCIYPYIASAESVCEFTSWGCFPINEDIGAKGDHCSALPSDESFTQEMSALCVFVQIFHLVCLRQAGAIFINMSAFLGCGIKLVNETNLQRKPRDCSLLLYTVWACFDVAVVVVVPSWTLSASASWPG